MTKFNKATINISGDDIGLYFLTNIRCEFLYKELIFTIFIDNEPFKEITGKDALNMFMLTNGEKRKGKKQTILNSFQVKKLATEICGTQISLIETKSRYAELVWARYLVFYYFRNYAEYSYSECGKLFENNYDHATVMFGLNKLENEKYGWRFDFFEAFKNKINEIHDKNHILIE